MVNTSLGAVIALLIDQVAKLYVLVVLDLQRVEHIDVLPPWVQFQMAWNRGVNFGLLSNESEGLRWGLIVLTLVIVCTVFIWSVTQFRRRFEQILAGVLVGGAVGNAIDRIYHGAVVDFLNMSCCGINNPFVFNLGDVAIFVGVVGLATYSMISPKKVE